MDDLEILRDAMLTIGIPPDSVKRTARGNPYPFCDWPLSAEGHRCLRVEWLPRARPRLDQLPALPRVYESITLPEDYWVNALVSSSTEYAVEDTDTEPVLWLGPFAPWGHKCRSKSGLQIAALASIYLTPRDPTINVWDGSKVTLKRIVGEKAWFRSDMVACPYCLAMLFPPEGYANE